MTLNQGVPTMNTFPPPTPPITYFGGLFTGRVEVSGARIADKHATTRAGQ